MSRRLTSFSVAILLATGACASTAGAPTVDTDRTIVITSSGTLRGNTGEELTLFTVRANPTAFWTALAETYAALGVPPTVDDPPHGIYGNQGFVMPRTLAGHRIDEYFDCGVSATGSRLVMGRVFATMMSTVTRPDSGSWTVQTRLTASYTSNEGASRAALPCGSRGLLESSLRDGVNARLGFSR